jgi:hypothetical protein
MLGRNGTCRGRSEWTIAFFGRKRDLYPKWALNRSMKHTTESKIAQALWSIIAAPFIAAAAVALFGVTPAVAVPFVLLLSVVIGVRGVLWLTKEDLVVAFEQHHRGLSFIFGTAWSGSPRLIAITQILIAISGICAIVFVIVQVSK